MAEIDARDDPRLTDYRSVSDPGLARARGLFVAEGRMILRRIVDDGRFAVRSVLVSHQARRDLEATLAKLEPYLTIYVCRTSDFLGITGFNIHRGCLALVDRPPAVDLNALLPTTDCIVVLEDVANADNVGGVFRNAAAFGAGAVLLSPSSCDPLYRKAIRTSMGAVLAVPFVQFVEWPAPLTALRQAGFMLVALTPREPSETLDAFLSRPRPRKVAIVIGNEGAGLTPAVEARADVRVRIPIRDRVDSLNLAVASGIALHRLWGG